MAQTPATAQSRTTPSAGEAHTPPRVTPTTGRLRRRPAVIALGAALTATGGLGAAWMATATTHTTAVLVITRTVDAGATIGNDDITVAQISAAPSIHTIPGAQLSAVVGKHTTVRLLPGQVLTPDAVTDTVTPPAGKSLVGVAVTQTQMPSQLLKAGDHILIVDTPNAQDTPPATTPNAIAAQILNINPVADTDKTVINVLVDADQARALAARVATGRIGIVLLPAGQAG